MGQWVKWVSFLDGSYGSWVDALSPMSKQWVDGSMGQMGQFFGWVIWSWVDALSPMTHLHIYRKHVVKATFVVGDS